MDLSFDIDHSRFSFRVAALIVRDDHLLVMRDERSPYYYLPGGRVKLHERAEDAIRRELAEELNAPVVIERALWFSQSFFTEDVSKRHFHELCVYFLAGLPSLVEGHQPFALSDPYGHDQEFVWITFDALAETYFYPTFVAKRIHDLPASLELVLDDDQGLNVQ